MIQYAVAAFRRLVQSNATMQQRLVRIIILAVRIR